MNESDYFLNACGPVGNQLHIQGTTFEQLTNCNWEIFFITKAAPKWIEHIEIHQSRMN